MLERADCAALCAPCAALVFAGVALWDRSAPRSRGRFAGRWLGLLAFLALVYCLGRANP